MKLTVLTHIDLPEDPLPFQEVESKIRHALLRAAQLLLTQAFQHYEHSFFHHNTAMVKKDRKAKWFKTLAGEVHHLRWRAWDGLRYRYPLDEWLQLKGRQGTTPAFNRMASSLAVLRPYRQAAREIQTWTGITHSSVSVWKT